MMCVMVFLFGDVGVVKMSVDLFVLLVLWLWMFEVMMMCVKNVVDVMLWVCVFVYRVWDDVEVFEVSETLRRDGAARNERFVEYVLFEGLFGVMFVDVFYDDVLFCMDV